jgi:hypothetical protein
LYTNCRGSEISQTLNLSASSCAALGHYLSEVDARASLQIMTSQKRVQTDHPSSLKPWRREAKQVIPHSSSKSWRRKTQPKKQDKTKQTAQNKTEHSRA